MRAKKVDSNQPRIEPARRCQYVIGIDPGVETGYAVKDTLSGKYDTVASDTIIAVMQVVLDWLMFNDVFVRVEDARLRKWVPKARNEKGERGRSQGAGSIKRDCQIWEEFLTKHNIPHEFVAPKDSKTKLDSKKFKMYTGWEGVTNGHGRDAGCLLLKY